jgi:hypothetical protein
VDRLLTLQQFAGALRVAVGTAQKKWAAEPDRTYFEIA